MTMLIMKKYYISCKYRNYLYFYLLILSMKRFFFEFSFKKLPNVISCLKFRYFFCAFTSVKMVRDGHRIEFFFSSF